MVVQSFLVPCSWFLRAGIRRASESQRTRLVNRPRGERRAESRQPRPRRSSAPCCRSRLATARSPRPLRTRRAAPAARSPGRCDRHAHRHRRVGDIQDLHLDLVVGSAIVGVDDADAVGDHQAALERRAAARQNGEEVARRAPRSRGRCRPAGSGPGGTSIVSAAARSNAAEPGVAVHGQWDETDSVRVTFTRMGQW